MSFDPAATDDLGATPLHWAAFTGNLAGAKVLIAHGAPLDVRDRTHKSLLLGWADYAAANVPHPQGDYVGVVRALLAAGAALPTGGVWSVVELATTKSKAGATFKKLDDLSYLAEGANGASDEYTFTFHTAQRRLTGLRLEALAHASLTKGGPGQSTTILVYKVYNDGFRGQDLGGSAAQSVILMVVVILLTVVQFRFIERKVHY